MKAARRAGQDLGSSLGGLDFITPSIFKTDEDEQSSGKPLSTDAGSVQDISCQSVLGLGRVEEYRIRAEVLELRMLNPES